MSRRRYLNDNSFGEIVAPIVVFYFFYLLLQYFTNRANFWKWLLYGLFLVIILIVSMLGWKELKYRRKQKRLDNFFYDIKKAGLEEYIQNFIRRFGLEKKRGSVWSYRDHSFDWNRLDDFRKFLRDKGVKISLDNWNDTSLLLQYYIQEKEEKLTRESISIPPQKFSNLTATDFEMLIYRLFEAIGYSVQHTGRVGDQGADLIANKGQERVLIQAKCYLNSPVGNDAVQQAVAAKNHYDCNKATVVTTSSFTTEAIELSKTNNVELISKKRLQEMLLEYLKENWD